MKTVLLPVKAFKDAKQRLSGFLDANGRGALARAMLADVLSALSSAREPDRVVVYSASAEALRMARENGFEAVEEPQAAGHSEAVNRMKRELGPDASMLLAIAADLPLLGPGDIDLLLTHPASGVVLVPSRDGTGTNAVRMSAGASIAMAYGDDSLRRHVARVRDAGLPVEVVDVAGVAFDVDTPSDLAEVRDRLDPASATAACLASLLSRAGR